MVTHLLDAEKIIEIARKTGVSAIQVHDDLPIEGMKKLRQALPDTELIKAIHVTGPQAAEKAKLYESYADFLLLDSRTADRLGGTGLTHDWNLSRQIVGASSIPVILAGGLNPENVAMAIRTVAPAGIDANSGLEDLQGRKDPVKLESFANQGQTLLKPFTLTQTA
jgi:phosphoribosylanthranilate isomerase